MGVTENERDAFLWNQFKDGEEEAFALVFRNYYPGLFNYGCKITTDHSLVEDCIQELFLDIWRSSGKADILSLKAYLFKAFKYKLLRQMEKSNKVKTLETEADHRFELSHEIFVVNKEEQSSLTKKIQAAFEELSPRQKEIIYLKFYQELSYEEVSEIMQINYQAARNLIYQAIKVLKKVMAICFLLV